MITLGIVDIVLIVLFLMAAYAGYRRRGTAVSILVAVLLVFVLIERIAPGTLTRIGDGIHQIDLVNSNGPHVTIDPIIRIEK